MRRELRSRPGGSVDNWIAKITNHGAHIENSGGSVGHRVIQAAGVILHIPGETEH
jgi:hypothetical protein